MKRAFKSLGLKQIGMKTPGLRQVFQLPRVPSGLWKNNISRMKKSVLISFSLLLAATIAQGQQYSQSPFNKEYGEWIQKANALYDAHEYQKSGEAFSKAFASQGNKGTVADRYNAACTWALAGNKDSAFSQLSRIANARYSSYNHLVIDPDLDGLHTDARWPEVAMRVKRNKDDQEEGSDKQLIAQLDTIMQTDQKYRMRIDAVAAAHGRDSKEMRDLWTTITLYDSLNLIKVTKIIDKYGWPGPEVAGNEGNQAVFLVIQHADIATQEKYLPMMRKAAKEKKAEPSSLALLEDRVALRQGKKQIYGSQIGGDGKELWVSPLEDPDNVDKRRAEVGLGPLTEYVNHWNIKWDVNEYKKKLPEIEQKEKMRNQ